MKARPLPLMTALLAFSISALSQQDSAYRLMLKTGAFIPKKNINSDLINEINSKVFRIQGQSFAVIQFEHIPTTAEREQLLKSGVLLMDYIPNNTYTVSMRGPMNEDILRQARQEQSLN